jgi:hypothetical protein
MFDMQGALGFVSSDGTDTPILGSSWNHGQPAFSLELTYDYKSQGGMLQTKVIDKQMRCVFTATEKAFYCWIIYRQVIGKAELLGHCFILTQQGSYIFCDKNLLRFVS